MASVGQGGYLSPMAAFAAAQMQHMATINGLPGAPLTPTSGNRGEDQWLRGHSGFLGISVGYGIYYTAGHTVDYRPFFTKVRSHLLHCSN